jgi:hypothetical protein
MSALKYPGKISISFQEIKKRKHSEKKTERHKSSFTFDVENA